MLTARALPQGVHCVKLPIFTIRYYDRDWEEEQELLVEDATHVEVQSALAEWLVHAINCRLGVQEPGCPLRGLILFQVEVQDV